VLSELILQFQSHGGESSISQKCSKFLTTLSTTGCWLENEYVGV